MSRWKQYWLLNVSLWLVCSLLVPLFSIGQVVIIIGTTLFVITVGSLIVFLLWLFLGTDDRNQGSKDPKEPFPDIDGPAPLVVFPPFT